MKSQGLFKDAIEVHETVRCPRSPLDETSEASQRPSHHDVGSPFARWCECANDSGTEDNIMRTWEMICDFHCRASYALKREVAV